MPLCAARAKWPVRYILVIAVATTAINVLLDTQLKSTASVDTSAAVHRGTDSRLSEQLVGNLKGQLSLSTKFCFDHRAPEYATLKYSASVEKGALAKTEITFQFRTSHDSALLLAEVNRRPSKNTRKDHLIVLLLRQRLYLLADAGQAPVSISVSRPRGFGDGRWHDVSVTKDDYVLRLAADARAAGGVGPAARGCRDAAAAGGRALPLCNATRLRAGSVEINTDSGLHMLSVRADVLAAVRALAAATLGLAAGVLDAERTSACMRDVTVRGRRYLAAELIHIVRERRKDNDDVVFVAKEINASLAAPVDLNVTEPIVVSGPTFAEFQAAGNRSIVSYRSLHQAPIVTGISDNHYKEVVDMIASSHVHMAKKVILVYNLGLKLHSVWQLKGLCWVKIRNIDLSVYLPHVRWLKSCAWKPLIIQSALQEFKAVIYADASTRFTAHISALIPLWQPVGILSRQTLGPASAYTHPMTFASFNVSATEFRSVSMAAAGILLIAGTEFVRQRIIQPWVRCAVRESCIVPGGLRYPPCVRGKMAYDYRCHRFDQSALTLLLFKAFGDRRLRPAMSPLVGNLTQTVRHPTHLYQVKVCK